VVIRGSKNTKNSATIAKVLEFGLNLVIYMSFSTNFNPYKQKITLMIHN
jgi:hypothetical protein